MGENAEIVRRGFEALSAGGVEAMLPMIDPDFEVSTPASLSAEPDTYRGHDGLRRYFDSFYDAMDEVHFEPHEFREIGDRVLVPCTLTARGRTTGLAFDQQAVLLWRLRDHKAVGVDVFPTVEEALAAAPPADG